VIESEALEVLIDGMTELDTKRRVMLLEKIGRLHGMAVTMFSIMETYDGCHNSPKDIVSGYLEAFGKDVTTSVELTCDANGMEYDRDPNKTVREEILNEEN
jgi:hypothetical protein